MSGKNVNPSKSLSKFIVLKFHKNQREIIIYEVKKKSLKYYYRKKRIRTECYCCRHSDDL